MRSNVVVIGLQDMSVPHAPKQIDTEALDWQEAVLEPESKPRQRKPTDFEKYAGKAKVVSSKIPFAISDPNTVHFAPKDWIIDIDGQFYGITDERFPFRVRLTQAKEPVEA